MISPGCCQHCEKENATHESAGFKDQYMHLCQQKTSRRVGEVEMLRPDACMRHHAIPFEEYELGQKRIDTRPQPTHGQEKQENEKNTARDERPDYIHHDRHSDLDLCTSCEMWIEV